VRFGPDNEAFGGIFGPRNGTSIPGGGMEGCVLCFRLGDLVILDKKPPLDMSFGARNTSVSVKLDMVTHCTEANEKV